ncbi:acyltransferase family protein [Saccharibacillus alkalitolerans]|uniref:Acyltransferase n=1 Tax=Saccharibacillus alkalitolerans TaxID=2705290 RepID=A0ABX0F546_9BACL|nr:acyltransferase [Saccharibacillus alkalitolerans]NGZ76057.1 acyltransferase [Saccharibacillus alkalitolerans]
MTRHIIEWTFGGIAVATFFIISGFLISASFERSTIKQYVINRTLRIFPGLLVVLALTVFVIGPLFTRLSYSDYFSNVITWSYFKNILLVNVQYSLPGLFENNLYPNAVNGSIWTLSYEVLCYIGLLILGYYGIFKNKKAVLLVFLLITAMSFFLPSTYSATNLNGFLLGELLNLIQFLAVGMVYYAYRDQINLTYKLALISLFALFASLYLGFFKETFLIAGSYLIFYAAFYLRPIIKFSKDKYVDLSYGVYIYAFPIQQTVQHLMHNQTSLAVNFSISLLVTLLFATFSWYVIEKPFLQLKHYKKKQEILEKSW